MDPEIIAEAKLAHAVIAQGGYNPQKVAAQFRENMGIDLPSPAAIQNYENALARLNQTTTGNKYLDVASDVGHALAQSLPFVGTLSDEARGLVAAAVPGGMGYTAARDAERQRLADVETVAPGAMGATKLAGALLGGLAFPAAPGVVKGGIIGGSQAGLQAFGAAEGGVKERATKAVLPTLGGAALGSIIGTLTGPVANLIARRAETGGEKFATALQAGSSARPYQMVQEEFDVARKTAKEMYRAFDSYEPVTPENILSAAQNNEISRSLQRKLTGKNWSFKQLQQMRNTLVKKGNPLGNELDDLMQARYSGLADADAQYFKAQEILRGIKAGKKAIGPSTTAADVRWQLGTGPAEALLRPGQIQSYKDAFVHQTVAKLLQNESDSTAALNKMLDMGSEPAAKLREFFPTDEAFNAFRNVLRQEKKVQNVSKAFRALAYPAARLAGYGIAGGIGARTASQMITEK
jgi:hypothetical protein